MQRLNAYVVVLHEYECSEQRSICVHVLSWSMFMSLVVSVIEVDDFEDTGMKIYDLGSFRTGFSGR